jgi:hypothetical protein
MGGICQPDDGDHNFVNTFVTELVNYDPQMTGRSIPVEDMQGFLQRTLIESGFA